MPITLTLTSLFVVVVVLVVGFVFWKRSQKLHQTNGVPSAIGGKRLAPSHKSPLGGELLEAVSPQTTFDPDATQIYKRSNPVSSAAAALNRQGAIVEVATLVGLSGSQRGRSYPIAETGITIGRGSSCDVVLDDHRVSSRHAWVGIIDGKAVLRDLESTNGTYLNTASQSPIHKVELCSGDTIFFGGHQGDQFRFVASGAASSSANSAE